MKNASLAALLLLSCLVPSLASASKQLGVIYKSCGLCDRLVWQENQTQAYVRSCDVIGYGGKPGEEDLGCDPNASQLCDDLQLQLLNQVSLGQQACDMARAEYAAQGCGELGWPNCALFSN